jgi:TetR/AcrR family transcriptional regulator, regulator of cefoperazone and chloramphenicol sensitivity
LVFLAFCSMSRGNAGTVIETGGDDVPARLLAAASEIFAAKGYDATTVREVVARARTNLNAVNYHFGGKEKLYAAVMRHQAGLAKKAHPPREAPAAGSSPEETIGRPVEDFLTLLLAPESLLPRLYARELLSPSAAYSQADVGGTEHQALHDAVAELLGPGADPADVRRCTRSVYAQCAYFMFVRHLLPMMEPSFRYSPEAVRGLARHITDFSLAGIRAIAARRG